MNRHPWAAHSSGNVFWEAMVALSNHTPLYQIEHSMHAASLDGLSQQHFTESRSTLQALLPNVDLGMFTCLDPGVWIDDNVMSLFIDCLRRGMPVPSSPQSSEVHPPSMLRTSKAIQVDFAELCILDSQHARLIQEASADGDWRKVFRIFAGFCKFNTVQRVLLPLCTSGNQIAVSSGTHWMLAELCLEDKVVCIYDWLPGKFQSDYELIAGVPHRVLSV